ncbi:hypothetical protein [Umezakia ovalisporum]|jgi:TolA-binding protein|uniref:Uncharacterized protein n=2 Tax=Umezakia ovalisporum TaxID=75695 RepID=A0AA43H084_9CYAN|nr:hypothetical protein [Umezakia ovalisporum]MBI1240714.1 hypothetical protein [Nostoc sp. RI_552]MDH6058312.1 hypothetical protein [Umezakia ovalisporum FSS-43]MDH6064353.1 hypothetical protein [Umezakia ovalisporum FSS-62]MDH6067967.1 hypothetical protein [Umezakia ovalisporum APH033B]MDH6071459.1 hypothetical protein [Umezakia ovalisporum CobakiLakeA]
MLRRLILAGIVVIVVWTGLFSHPAVSQQIESRFNNLVADFHRFESRLNKVESKLSGTGQLSSARTYLTPPQSSDTQGNLSHQEQMFERLATLLVELKQQVNQLEKKVAELESR